jgi:hypothetical protein
MRILMSALAGFALMIGISAMVEAQSQAQPEISNPDAAKPNTHDRPAGRGTVRIPGMAGAGETPPPPPPNNPVPPSEGDDIPPVETPPNPPPPEDPPTYYGEPVHGKFAFLLDASGSMHGNRIATVRAETTSVIQELTEQDEFDCNAYGSQFSAPDFTTFLWGELMIADEGNKSSAVSWVNGSATNPGGMTPTAPCLRVSCEIYPSDLTKMFLLTDGYPNWPSGQGDASYILTHFPSWWSKFEDATLVAICIGGVGSAQQFMQNLAALAGGVYISA